jgi:hypothetical protein
MDQPKDSLVRYMDKIIENYPTFSNVTLGYKNLKKRQISFRRFYYLKMKSR